MVLHFLRLSVVAFLACFLAVVSENLPIYELQARCAARCLVYDPHGKEQRSVGWGPYSFGSNFQECIAPCEKAPLGEDCIQLCAKKNFSKPSQTQNCTASCDFLEKIKTSKARSSNRFPLPIDNIPEYNSTTEILWWKTPKEMYHKKRYDVYPVVFVIQSATIGTLEDRNNLNATDLQWVAHRPTFYNSVFPQPLVGLLNTSLLYLFRVASFNEFGSRHFSEMSKPLRLRMH
jgi:hypothetical protein